jgi:molecular chaperone Hsp33
LTDQLLPFLLEARGVRGFAVEIHSGLRAMLGSREYSPDVMHLLGQAIAATPLLAADLRDEGRFNLQFQGHGPLKLLVAQIDQQLNLRGMAKADADAEGSFAELMRDGLLACILDPRAGAEKYQAVVDIRGATLAEALEGYFERSAQLPALIRLAAGPDRLAGLFLQRLPEGLGQVEENWAHVKALFATLAEEELLAVDAITLLSRLFAEDDCRVFEARPVKLACRCEHASISAMLLALGEEELEPVLKDHGKVEVTCEFCGRVYAYTDLEVRQLFEAAKATAADEEQTRQ